MTQKNGSNIGDLQYGELLRLQTTTNCNCSEYEQ